QNTYPLGLALFFRACKQVFGDLLRRAAGRRERRGSIDRIDTTGGYLVQSVHEGQRRPHSTDGATGVLAGAMDAEVAVVGKESLRLNAAGPDPVKVSVEPLHLPSDG